jgi:hypothetical protein
MARKVVDYRKILDEIGCMLTVAGGEDEVIDAAVAHAITSTAQDTMHSCGR